MRNHTMREFKSRSLRKQFEQERDRARMGEALALLREAVREALRRTGSPVEARHVVSVLRAGLEWSERRGAYEWVASTGVGVVVRDENVGRLATMILSEPELQYLLAAKPAPPADDLGALRADVEAAKRAALADPSDERIARFHGKMSDLKRRENKS
jgi:hypothetical protein